MLRFISASFVFSTFLFASSANARASEIPLRNDLNENVVMLKVAENIIGMSVELETTIFKPNGDGPFPLIIINDGKEKGNSSNQKRARYTVLAEEFLSRGYAVALPMPRGFSNSSGLDQTKNCDIYNGAKINGKDIRHLIESLKEFSFINKDKIIIMGQSYGGLNSLAAVSEKIQGVKLVVNFAGGIRYDESECNWKQELKRAMNILGSQATVQSIWFYGENDSLFSNELINEMFKSYTSNGADAQLILYGKFRKDSHTMFGTLDGFNTVWWPTLMPILKVKGFNVDGATSYNRISQSGKQNNLSINPPEHLNNSCKKIYQQMIDENIKPRAFSVSSEGNCGYVADYDDPQFWAVNTCNIYSKSKSCKLHVIDDFMVP